MVGIEEGGGAGNVVHDPKVQTWLEVQARSKQTTVDQFYKFTMSKREEVSSSSPPTPFLW